MIETYELAAIRDPLLLAYEERLRRLRRHPSTVKQYRQTARKFQELLDDVGTPADRIAAVDIEEWLASLELKPSTKHAHLKRLRSAFHYAHRRGAVQGDPTRDVALERVPDEQPRIVPNEALRKIRAAAASDREWAAFHLLAYAGLRRCEVILLSWEDVDFAGQTLSVMGKGGKLRHVPIHPALAEALHEVTERHERILAPRSGRAIGTDTWDDMIRALTGGQWTAHDFRRTVASSLALNDVPDPLIDRIMGWAPRAVGRRYYINVAGPQLLRAILKLYADDPLG